MPDSVLAETLLDLRTEFGAVSCETQSIRGLWQHQGEVYRDELVRVFLDVEDHVDNRRFFQDYKQKLKERFAQLDIWITSYPVEVL